jgi:hypothetical protein
MSIADEVAKRFIIGRKDGYQLFQGQANDRYDGVSRYVYLGSLGPDLPYYYDADSIGKITGRAGKSEYADIFHYNKEGEFILQLVSVARGMDNAARRERTMGFALGFATHLAADTIIHPYVNCYAGAYNRQSIEELHMTSEVHQDSYLAQKYFNRKSIAIQSDDGDTWKKYLPPCLQVGIPGLPAYTKVSVETEEVLSDVAAAFKRTHGMGPDTEYLKDSYENLYDIAIDIGYDTAAGPIPRYPHQSLVQHERLKPAVIYYPGGLRDKAVAAATEACGAIIALFKGGFSDEDQDSFRSTVKNWNMDTGYWLDVSIKDGRLQVIWRHRWC